MWGIFESGIFIINIDEQSVTTQLVFDKHSEISFWLINWIFVSKNISKIKGTNLFIPFDISQSKHYKNTTWFVFLLCSSNPHIWIIFIPSS